MSIAQPGPPPSAFDGGSLVNLMASLIEGLGGAAPAGCPPLATLSAAEVADARTVVLFLVDGMGDHLLARHGNLLRRWQRGTLTSVFPTSTAPAVTTILTGQPPSRHGITGWFMNLRELATSAAILAFRSRWGGQTFDHAGVDASQLVGGSPIFQRLPVRSYVLMPRPLVDTPYTRSMSGPAERLAYDALEDCLAAVVGLAQAPGSERRYVYAYWPRLDSLCHIHGSHSHLAVAHLVGLERAIVAAADALRGSNSLLLITADHGFTDAPREARLCLEAYPQLQECLTIPLTGEPRVAYCHVRAGWDARFEQRFDEAFHGGAELYRSQALIDAGWFGPGPVHPRLSERVGDYAVVCGPGRVLIDQLATGPEFEQLGVHGGISEEELQVPLLSVRC